MNTLLLATSFAAPLRGANRFPLTLSDDAIADILTGVVEGFFIGDDITKDDIKPCLATLDDTKLDVLDAVRLISNGTAAEMVKGLSKLGDALQHIPSALRDCQVAEEDVQKIIDAIEQIQDIKSFAYVIGKHLTVNGVDILDDIQDGLDAFNKKDYTLFGEKVGDAMRLLFLGNTPDGSMTLSTPNDATMLVSGITKGFFHSEFKLTANCVQDIDFREIHLAVALIEDENANSALQGVKHLAKALHSLPQVLKKCAATENQIDEVTKALGVLGGSSEFKFLAEKHFQLNGVEIYNELVPAIVYWHQEMYEHFGLEIGAILYKIRGVNSKKQLTFTEEEAFQVARGVVTGFFLGETVLKPSCISNVDTFVQDVTKAIELFNRETAEDAREALRLLGESLNFVKDAMIQCEAQEEHIAEITKAIAALLHPAQFSYVIGRNLFVNGSDIYDKLQAAIQDWQSQQYYPFGVQVGLILNDILVPEPNEIIV